MMDSGLAHHGLIADPGDQDQLEANFAKLRQTPVILYGAGKIGTRLHMLFTRMGIKVKRVWDKNAEKLDFSTQMTAEYPAPLSIPETQRGDYLLVVTVFAENVAADIRDQFRAQGYAGATSSRTFINSLLHAECKIDEEQGTGRFELWKCHMCPVQKERREGCDVFATHVQRELAHGVPKQPDDGMLIVQSMGILVSSKCNLTCIGCNHLRDLYEPQHNIDIDADLILSDVRKVADAADLLRNVVVVGGESFMHKKLGKILEGILAMPRIGVVQIITNGTIVPKDRGVFDLLTSSKVVVEVSGYGDSLPRKQREDIETFLGLLKERRVLHLFQENLYWFDFGTFEHRHYDDAKLKEIYDSCCFVSHDLFNGRLYKCSRSAYGEFIGRSPHYPGDSIDVRTSDRATLRRDLRAYLKLPWVEACQHCAGTSTSTIKAGVQVVKFKGRKRPAASSAVAAVR